MAEKTVAQRYLDTEKTIKALPEGASKTQLLGILDLVKQDLLRYDRIECVEDLQLWEGVDYGRVFTFVSDSQDVEAIKSQFPEAGEYDSFFTMTKDGDYVAIYGMYNIIPWNGKRLFKVL